MFWRILQQSFSRQRRRKTLALLAVMAGMAVVTAMLTLRVTLGDDLSAELRHIGANILVRPAADSLPVMLNGVDLRPAGSGALLPERDLPQIKTIFWTNNIVGFAPLLDTQAWAGSRRVAVEGTYFRHPITVPGTERQIKTGIEGFGSAWAVAGAWPAEGTQQVLAGVALARELGVKAGSRLDLHGAAGGPPEAVTVAGIVTSGAGEDHELLAPLALAQRLAGEPGMYRRLLVSAVTKPEDAFARENPESMTAAERERWMCSPYAITIATQLEQALPGSSAAVVRPVATSEGVILSQLKLVIWLVTLLALVASGLAISGAMGAAVLERRGEIALMKAVGADDGAIGALVFTEAVLLGVAGGLIGFMVGEWLAAAIAWRVVGHSLGWKPALAPVVLLLAVAVAVAGSWQPLRRAMRIDPAVVLRGEA
ncbi:MAG: ABC transporter permease [Terriglobales bacterium]